MVVELPERFLNWNYYPRRDQAKRFLEGKIEQDMSKFFLESTRHNPALCTACPRGDGSLFVNAKIVGAGYVLKKQSLPAAIKALKRHLENGDRLFREAGEDRTKREKAVDEYQREAMQLLVEVLYHPKEKAHESLDFTKISTMELAKTKRWSSKHTWETVQKNATACLIFYQPPTVSFELHGSIEIHVQDSYHDFVSAVHDSFHYVPPEKRQTDRPVYIFNVEEVYDNSPMPTGFGTKIA